MVHFPNELNQKLSQYLKWFCNSELPDFSLNHNLFFAFHSKNLTSSGHPKVTRPKWVVKLIKLIIVEKSSFIVEPTHKTSCPISLEYG